MKNDNTKISGNRQKKMVLGEELNAKVAKSTGIIFTNYSGLTHQQLEGLKRGIKKLDGDFVIAKNTLLKRALTNDKRLNAADLKSEFFDQPTAALFAYADLIEPLKVLTKSIKELNLPLIKGGFMDGHVLSEPEVTRLATLPSKSVLQAQVLGMMKSPIQGLHRSLNWNLQKFVMTLSAIEKQKAQ